MVLLDHGLYHTVPDGMRRDLCKLLLASVSPFSTRRRREALARRFAGPLFKFFPPILSPWFVFSSRLTSGDLYAAAKQQLPQNVSMKDVGECLVALHDAQGEGGKRLRPRAFGMIDRQAGLGPHGDAVPADGRDFRGRAVGGRSREQEARATGQEA